jgi:hypothetical protein
MAELALSNPMTATESKEKRCSPDMGRALRAGFDAAIERNKKICVFNDFIFTVLP